MSPSVMKKFLRLELLTIVVAISVILGVSRLEAQPHGTSIFDNIICNHINGASCPGGGGGGIVNGVTASVPLASSGGSTPNISVANKIGNSNFIQYGSGSNTPGDCAEFDASGNVIDAAIPCIAPPVTSVSSSNALVTVSPTTGAVHVGLSAVKGNGTTVQATTGGFTSNDCTKYDATGNVVDAGAPCGTGTGGVTATTGTSPIVVTPTTGAPVVSCPTCLTTASTSVIQVVNYQSGNPLAACLGTSSAECTLYTFTLPGGTMTAQSVLTLVSHTYLNGTTIPGGDTFNLRLYFGSTAVASTGATGLASTSIAQIRIAFEITNQNATNVQVVSVTIADSNNATNGTVNVNSASTWQGGNTATVDTTVSQLVKVTIQFSSALGSSLSWNSFDGSLTLIQ